MRYFGGKVRLSGKISSIINSMKFSHYIEPFCGMYSVGLKVNCPNKVASDYNENVITLWKAVQDGWIPPDNISKSEYILLKNQKTISPLKSFAGFGCSHSGKWFGGYASDKSGRNYALNAKKSLLKSAPLIRQVEFHHMSYQDIEIPPNSLVYCDPPYINTTGFSTGEFDHDKFWTWVDTISKTAIVLVSEYVAPPRFECIAEFPVKTDMKNSDNNKIDRVERIFCKKKLSKNTLW